MSGRHGHKPQPKKRNPDRKVASGHTSLCQEHPDAKKEGDMESKQTSPPPPPGAFTLKNAALLVSVMALVATFMQACYMRQAMRVDQRAWVNIGKTGVPIFGKNIVTPFQIRDLGKTPAIGVRAFIRARPLKATDQIEFGSASSQEIQVPTLFPQAYEPFQVTATDKDGKDIQLDLEPMMHGDFLNGSLVLVVHGNASYSDIFGIEHSMKFCEIFTDTPQRPLDHSFDQLNMVCLAHNGIDQQAD